MFVDFVTNTLGISDGIVCDVTIAVLGVLFVSLIISFVLGFIASLTYKLFR